MIVLERKRLDGIKASYTIYEAGDIVPATVRLVPYAKRFEAMRGEYVEDINGRFVPLLRRICINKDKNHHNMIFPGHTWQPFKNVMFSYPLEKASMENVPVGLTGKDILVAKLIDEGIDAEVCVKRAYPRYGRRQVINYLMRIFHNPAFLQYLFQELGYVKKLKAALVQRGVSVDSIAEQIEGLINNDHAVPTLRKWALETALAALETQDRMQHYPELVGDKNLDDIMAHLVEVKELPQLPSHNFPSASTEAG